MLAELAAAEAGRVEARRLREADRVVAEADLIGVRVKVRVRADRVCAEADR